MSHLRGEWQYKGSHYFLEWCGLSATPLLERVQSRQSLLIDGCEVAGHYRSHQSIAAAKMVVHRGHIGTCRLRDIPDRYRLKAIFCKQLFRCLNEAEFWTFCWNKRSFHAFEEAAMELLPLSNKCLKKCLDISHNRHGMSDLNGFLKFIKECENVCGWSHRG